MKSLTTVPHMDIEKARVEWVTIEAVADLHTKKELRARFAAKYMKALLGKPVIKPTSWLARERGLDWQQVLDCRCNSSRPWCSKCCDAFGRIGDAL